MASTEQSIQYTPEVKPESQEYIDQMAAKGEQAVNRGNNGFVPEVPSKPEHIPAKFWNAQTGEVDTVGMAKSYAELEKRFSQPKAPENVTPPAEPKAGEENKPAEQSQTKPNDTLEIKPENEANADADKALQSVGLNLQEFNTEFAEKQSLSEGSYEKLAKAGIDKATVDSYIAGQQALAERTQNNAMAEIGGKENFTSMAKWAGSNVPPAELQAFNASVTSGNQEQINLAMRGMYARYTQAVGNEPARSVGGHGGDSGVKGFASRNEMTEAMKDKRYGKDPAYTNSVVQRIDASNIF